MMKSYLFMLLVLLIDIITSSHQEQPTHLQDKHQNSHIHHFDHQTNIPHIAVCICGQLGRLNLESAFQHLFLPNTDVQFTLFYALQEGNLHNTGTNKVDPSPYANYTAAELAHHIHKVYFNKSSSSEGPGSGSGHNHHIPSDDGRTSYHLKLGGIHMIPIVGKDGWEQRLGIALLHTQSHVFQQKWMRPLTPMILEMYGHQVECAREIIRYEHKLIERENYKETDKVESKGVFDYILSIREDLYFFDRIHVMRDLIHSKMHPISSSVVPISMNRKLTEESQHRHSSLNRLWNRELFPILDDTTIYNAGLYNEYVDRFQPIFDGWNKAEDLNTKQWHDILTSSSSDNDTNNEVPLSTTTPIPTRTNVRCQFLSKDCLKWSGVNIRFELYDRVTGLVILQSRISYYKYLWILKRQVYNPESFNLFQVTDLHANICNVNSIILPLTVVRLQMNEYCFEKDEIFNNDEICYPLQYHDFIYSHWCKHE